MNENDLSFIPLPISYSYTILAPNVVKDQPDPKIATKGILETIALETELYRLGNTKACEIYSKNSLSSHSFLLSPSQSYTQRHWKIQHTFTDSISFQPCVWVFVVVVVCSILILYLWCRVSWDNSQ